MKGRSRPSSPDPDGLQAVDDPDEPEAVERSPIDLRLLAPALVAWIAVASLLAAPAPAVGALLLVLLIPGVWLGRRRSVRRRSGSGWGTEGSGRSSSGSILLLVLVATALAVLALLLQRGLRGVGTIRDLSQQGASVVLRAEVTSEPQLLPGTGPRRTPLVVVRLQVSEVVGRGARSRVHAPVLAFADTGWLHLIEGEQVEVRGRLAPPEAGDDVSATLSGKGIPVIRAPPSPVERWATQLRSGLGQATVHTTHDGGGLLPGLVVGDTSRLDPGLKTAMQSTGLTHLVAVSGSNVAIVCGTALLLTRWLGVPRRLRPWLAGATLIGFVIVARPEPSVLRAAVMGGIGLIGLGRGRRGQGVPALSAAIVALLVVDPWLSRSYGFALSSLATLGLLLFARPWGEALARWLPRPIAFAIAVPLAAQAACGPVIVLLQGSVSLISVPANLVVAPLVAPATVAGVAASAISLLSPGLAHWVAWAGVIPASGIAAVARVAQRAPALPWPGGAFGALSLAVLTIGLIVAAGPLARACWRHPWAAASMAPMLVAGLWPVPTLGWPPPAWVMVMCDVGQGDGLVLDTGPGHAIVVDTGPDPVLMDGCLRRLGVGTVDLLVLTHDHSDHVEGVPGVLHHRRVGELLLNGLDDPASEARRIAGWARAAHLETRVAHAGDLGSIAGVSWQVLWPAYVMHQDSVPNNNSLVLLVRTHGLRLLLLGDVETPAARQVDLALRQASGGPKVDVLKVAHHGSALQDPGLIHDVGAPLAMISDGKGNTYGHPAPATVRLLLATGALVRRTDLDGDIAVISRGGRLAVETRHR